MEHGLWIKTRHKNGRWQLVLGILKGSCVTIHIQLVSRNQRQPVKCKWLLGQTVTAVQEHGVLGVIGGTWPFWKGVRVQRSWHGLNGRLAKLDIRRK